MRSYEEIIDGVISGKLYVGVWGIGFLGSTLFLNLQKAGFSVVGIDTDPKLITDVREGKGKFKELAERYSLSSMLESPREVYDLEQMRHLQRDIFLHVVCVPTERENEPTNENLLEVIKFIKRRDQFCIIIIESTISPDWLKYIRSEVPNALIASAPRRDWLSVDGASMSDIPRVIGADQQKGDIISKFYNKFCNNVHIASNSEHACMVKIVENLYRYVDLSLTNQIAEILYEFDVNEILELASTKWNVQLFHPGFGIGGMCIPLAPHFFNSINNSHESTIISNAINYNDRYDPLKLINCLLTPPIAILGLGYQPNIRVHHLSPVIRICQELKRLGLETYVHDPLFSNNEIKEICGVPKFQFPEELEKFPTIILCTKHDVYKTLPDNLMKASHTSSITFIDQFGSFREFSFPDNIKYFEFPVIF